MRQQNQPTSRALLCLASRQLPFNWAMGFASVDHAYKLTSYGKSIKARIKMGSKELAMTSRKHQDEWAGIISRFLYASIRAADATKCVRTHRH